VSEITRVFTRDRYDSDTLRHLLGAGALPDNWREYFEELLRQTTQAHPPFRLILKRQAKVSTSPVRHRHESEAVASRHSDKAAQRLPGSRQSFSYSSTSYFSAAFRIRLNAASRSSSVTPST
jgi:hypothetical protein